MTLGQGVWADLPGFGTVLLMGNKKLDPHTRAEILKRLRQLQEAMALDTDYVWAKRIGMSPSQWGNFKKGERDLTVPAAYGVCAGTGVTFGYIFEGKLYGENCPEDLRDKLLEIRRANAPLVRHRRRRRKS